MKFQLLILPLASSALAATLRTGAEGGQEAPESAHGNGMGRLSTRSPMLGDDDGGDSSRRAAPEWTKDFPMDRGVKDVYDDELDLPAEKAIDKAIEWLIEEPKVGGKWPFKQAVDVFGSAIKSAYPSQKHEAEMRVNDRGEQNRKGWYYQKEGDHVSKEMRRDFVEDLVYGASDWHLENYRGGDKYVRPDGLKKDILKSKIAASSG